MRALEPAKRHGTALTTTLVTLFGLCGSTLFGEAHRALEGTSSLLSSASCPESGWGPPFDLPGAETAADPAILLVDGVYYLYPTTTGVSIEAWSSVDLETWRYEGVVWGPAPPGAWNDAEVWAPDVLAHEGTFYLYYTANGFIGVAASQSPTGPFVDVFPHQFVGGGRGNTFGLSIDPHVFRDDDGSLYFYSTAYQPTGRIRGRPMTSPTELAGGWTTLVEPAVFGWEALICEAPWVVKRDGTYYLMYSGNYAWTADYSVGVASSSSPLGPFTKSPFNPVLRTDDEAAIWGPGHNSVASDGEGGLLVFFHTKTQPSNGWDREVRCLRRR